MKKTYCVEWILAIALGLLGVGSAFGRNIGDAYMAVYTCLDSDGTPVEGQNITLKIQKASNGYWFDFNDSVFKNESWGNKSVSLSEDTTEHQYYYAWTPPAGETAPEQYLFVYDNTNTTYKDHQIERVDYQAIGNSTFAGGAVASVTSGVTVTTNNDKTGYTVSTVQDKTGYALTSAYDASKTSAQAGDAMTLTEAYDAAKTALPAGSYTAPDNAGIAAIQAKTDNLPSDPADESVLEALIGDLPTAAENRAEMDTNSTKLADTLSNVTSTKSTAEAINTTVNDIPNTSEFEARTLPSDDYFNSSADPVWLNQTTVE